MFTVKDGIIASLSIYNIFENSCKILTNVSQAAELQTLIYQSLFQTYELVSSFLVFSFTFLI